MAHFLDPRYHSSRKQTGMEGDMDWSMFPQYLERPIDIRRENYYDYVRRLIQDRRDIPRVMNEHELPPKTTNQIKKRMNLHMYGSFNPIDPYTDDIKDFQFRGKDPNGIRLDNVRWDKYLDIAQKHAEEYDFAPSGTRIDDSGTNPPDLYQDKWNKSKNWLRVLYKNFREGLDTLNPRGLFRHDPDNIAMLYYGAINSHDIPIQTTNVARIMSTLIPTDVNYRSASVPTHDPNMGSYGHGVKSAGMLPMGAQQQSLYTGIYDDQLAQSITITPPVSRDPTGAITAILKNANALDRILSEQEVATQKRSAWVIPPEYNNKNLILTSTDAIDTQRTLIPHVQARITSSYKNQKPMIHDTGIKSDTGINNRRQIPISTNSRLEQFTNSANTSNNNDLHNIRKYNKPSKYVERSVKLIDRSRVDDSKLSGSYTAYPKVNVTKITNPNQKSNIKTDIQSSSLPALTVQSIVKPTSTNTVSKDNVIASEEQYDESLKSILYGTDRSTLPINNLYNGELSTNLNDQFSTFARH